VMDCCDSRYWLLSRSQPRKLLNFWRASSSYILYTSRLPLGDRVVRQWNLVVSCIDAFWVNSRTCRSKLLSIILSLAMGCFREINSCSDGRNKS
jgi:hypothetical protein